MSSRKEWKLPDSRRTFSKRPKYCSRETFRLSVFLVALLPIITLGATSWPAGAAVPARLDGVCPSDLQWSASSPANQSPSNLLFCLQTSKGLRWKDPGKVRIDTHLNSVLMKCGDQLQEIDVAKTDTKLLSTFKLAVTHYVSDVLHLRVVRIQTSTGFYNLNVKYYRQVGMCSGGVGSIASYVGPDSRIPGNSTLLWEAFAYCQIGPQRAPLDFAFARVGNSWKFVALGGITSQPIYQ